jgi:hypothetical protein
MSPSRQKWEPRLWVQVLAQRWGMTKSPDKDIQKIEETQAALRESIEQAKELAEEAQKLLKKHKKALKDQSN